MFLTMVSFVLVLVTLPFSLCVTVKVVQEYERAVVFRLGRLRSGGAKGPGLFFVMPCFPDSCNILVVMCRHSEVPLSYLHDYFLTYSVSA